MQLNNIIKISVLPCEQIAGFLRISQTEARLNDDLQFEELSEIHRPAALTIEEKVEDRQRICTAKLVFTTCDKWPESVLRMAYLCETADGDRYLLGNHDRPFPVTTRKSTHPNNFADNQLTEVTVTYSSDKVIPIII
ncbi:hypothetical protein SAMN05216455_10211 [Segatella bryantii]|jgi:hypothetical protein|uniref:hypothetical protein n=1 Tax=Segatella bryantii TaxID=77095 RepID=UPI0008954161|nr:hypothetical protein [Segatella bryantii]SDZ94281.1 hypothetical protein SAMN05216455_10211 [Segatella bryantii]